MTIDNTDLPEHYQEVFDRLENIKKDVHNLAVTLLLEGELKPRPNTTLGETCHYDFNLCVRDSLDPDVQALSNLIDKVDETISAIRGNK